MKKTIKIWLCSLSALLLIANTPLSFVSNAESLDIGELVSESMEELDNIKEEPLQAESATTSTYGDFSYTLEHGKVTLTKYNNSTATSVTIPETINGYPVTSIGDECFRIKKNIVSVDFGNVLEEIGFASFEGCTSLTEIHIPNSVKYIENAAFSACGSLLKAYIPRSTMFAALEEGDAISPNLIFSNTSSDFIIYSTSDSYAYQYYLDYYKGYRYGIHAKFYDINKVPLESISIQNNVTVNIGESFTISPTFYPSNTSWTDDYSYAQFSGSYLSRSGNTFTALKAGTVELQIQRVKTNDTLVYMPNTITSNTCKVTIKDPTQMSLQIDGEDVTDKTLTYDLGSIPLDSSNARSIYVKAVFDTNYDKEDINFVSSNPSVAYVSKLNFKGDAKIELDYDGTATITATSEKRGLIASVTINVTSVKPESVSFDKSEITVNLNETGTLKLNYAPLNVYGGVYIILSDGNIADYDYKTGNVTSRGLVGSTKVTARIGKSPNFLKAEATITVVRPTDTGGGTDNGGGNTGGTDNGGGNTGGTDNGGGNTGGTDNGGGNTGGTDNGGGNTGGTDNDGGNTGGTDNVKEQVVGSIKLNASKFNLQKGKTIKTLAIKNSLIANDPIVSIKSSNPKVVKASLKGNTIILKGQKTSSKYVTVTVKTKSGATDTCKVKVVKGAVKTSKVVLNTKKLTLKKGKSQKLVVTRNPISALDKITYTSSNKKIATVDKNGKIKAKKKGKVTITVRAGSKKATCKVTVK